MIIYTIRYEKKTAYGWREKLVQCTGFKTATTVLTALHMHPAIVKNPRLV